MACCITVIHVQGQCLVAMVSSENIYGGCCKFSESAHGVGFYMDNLYINKCIISLNFSLIFCYALSQ